MAVTTRGMRITEDTLAQLQRLVRLSGKSQYSILARAIDRTYQATLNDPKFGPALRALEELDRLEPASGNPEGSRRRGAVIRLSEAEAVGLRRRAFEEYGDPGQAPQIAREAIRQKLLEKDEG